MVLSCHIAAVLNTWEGTALVATKNVSPFPSLGNFLILNVTMEKDYTPSVRETADSAYSDLSDDVVFDEKATKRLIRKIDLVLLPVLSFLYLYVDHALNPISNWLTML